MSNTQATMMSRMVKQLKAGQAFLLSLELMIVVLGIFIGFQLDRWYEQIQDSRRAIEYVERLTLNLEDDITALKGAVIRGQSRLESTDRIIRSLVADDEIKNNPSQFITDLEQSLYRYGLVSNNAAFTELVSTGDLAILPVSLRGGLHAYYGIVERSTQFDASIQAIQNESYKRFAGVLSSEQMDISIMLPNINPRREYSTDEARASLSRLRAKQEAIDWLPRLRQAHMQEIGVNNSNLLAAEKLMAKLAEYQK